MDDFPEVIRRFVAEYISSVDQLEALLLMRSQADREWSAADISRELYIGLQPAAARLAVMESQGLLAREEGAEPRFHYRPRTAELGRVVEQLAALYKIRRNAIVTLIYSQPLKHVKSFADAFRIWKGD